MAALRLLLLAPAVLAAPLAGCGGSLRLYSGAPRPLLEIARVRGWSESNRSPEGTLVTTTKLVAVDGVPAVGFREVELEPGPVVVRVSAQRTWDDEPLWRFEDELTFEAVAGGDYDVRAVPAEHAHPVALGVWDARFERCVATTEPVLEQVARPRLALDADWHLADWSVGPETRRFTYLPRGQQLGRWSRAVEAQFHAAGGRTVRAPELAQRLDELVDARCDEAEVTFVLREPDAVGGTWTGREVGTGRREWGVALLRPAAGGFDLLAHVDTGRPLPEDEVARWIELFRAAGANAAEDAP